MGIASVIGKMVFNILQHLQNIQMVLYKLLVNLQQI